MPQKNLQKQYYVKKKIQQIRIHYSILWYSWHNQHHTNEVSTHLLAFICSTFYHSPVQIENQLATLHLRTNWKIVWCWSKSHPSVDKEFRSTRKCPQLSVHFRSVTKNVYNQIDIHRDESIRVLYHDQSDHHAILWPSSSLWKVRDPVTKE